jgi:large subunit ribosomal protein L17
MRHQKFSQRLSRPSGSRRATLRNLVIALLRFQKIRTTKAKARLAQPLAERLISLAKQNDLRARRQALSILNDRSAVSTLFLKTAPLFKDRHSGFTRIIRLSHRRGDGAEMVLLEFIEKIAQERPKETKKEKPAQAQKAPVSKPERPKPEVKLKDMTKMPKEKIKPPKKFKPKKFLGGLRKLFKKERDSL